MFNPKPNVPLPNPNPKEAEKEKLLDIGILKLGIKLLNVEDNI